MACKFPNIASLMQEAEIKFESLFSKKPDIAVFAPGRVNLIGEHTDYNEGFVFPMALPLVTVIVGKRSDDLKTCRIKSLNESLTNSDIIEFLVPSETHKLMPGKPSWANYIKGVIANFHKSVPGFEAVINSTVPLGGGLSSSAALEVATYTFLEALSGSSSESATAKALACQKAEHEYAEVPCGIMDQFISVMGAQGHAVLIDCKSLESSLVPMNDPSVTFIITNSNVKHSLSGSEYPTRRNQCFSAAKLMNKSSLREASLSDIENIRGKMDEEMLKRVRHVITEIERTKRAASALKNGDYYLFGRLMNESHNSLRVDYEVSCPELDQLVSIASTVAGVFGSRMTGGGFGGCTVALIKKEFVDNFITKIKENYEGNPTFYVCSPSDGAKVLYNHSHVK